MGTFSLGMAGQFYTELVKGIFNPHGCPVWYAKNGHYSIKRVELV